MPEDGSLNLLIISTCLVFLFGAKIPAISGKEHDPRKEAFAFSNNSGTRLLALSPVAHPHGPLRAVCPGGRIFRVTYLKRQQATSNDTGRATAPNFDNYVGDLFRIVGGRTQADSTCLLIEETSLKRKTVVKSTPLGDKRCDQMQTKRVGDEKGRAVAQCWRKMRLPSGKELVIVLFVGKGKNALASLVLLTPQKLAFRDFPGQDDETSTWRVDDGGILEPKQFEILFVMKHGDTLEVGLSWAGAEGAALRLLEVEGKSFRTILESYRYWAPS